MAQPQLHPQCEAIGFLLGRWRGEGKGQYPTIDDFHYGEEVHFWHRGRPFLLYEQRTWSLEDTTPLHSEMGYWRPQPRGRIEIVLAHGFGLAEVQEGSVEGSLLRLRSTRLAPTSTCKDINEIRRTVEVVGDVLVYDVEMAAVGRPLQRHLHAELERVE